MNTWYAVEKELNAVCPKMKVRQKVPMGECTSFLAPLRYSAFLFGQRQ